MLICNLYDHTAESLALPITCQPKKCGITTAFDRRGGRTRELIKNELAAARSTRMLSGYSSAAQMISNMPPAGEHLWIQAMLIGIVSSTFGILHRIHPAVSTGLSALAVVVVFSLNAALCGILTHDAGNSDFANFIPRGVKGFAGSILIVIGLLDYFSLAPIAAGVLSGFHWAIRKVNPKPNSKLPQNKRFTFSLVDLMLLLGFVSIVAWQLAIFVRYDAF